MKKGTVKNKNAEVLRPPSGWMVVEHNNWRMGCQRRRERVGTLFDATRTRPTGSVKLTFQVETPQRVQVQVVAEISERHDLFFR